ncbi:MAG: MiaB/RimO family radical SAM methylthiotransferase [Phycisphaerales bacterium]
MPRGHVYLETFGCQMNELDSELVTGQLRALGYAFTPHQAKADVVLYNTCSVREHAEQKVWSRLGELAARKATEPALVVGVLGCMAEREGEALFRRMPVVDIMCGPGELDRLPTLLDNALRTRTSLLAEPSPAPTTAETRLVSARESALQGNANRRSSTLAAAADNLELLDLSRSVSAEDHPRSAYVRITRGCNKYCTYCVVPFTRGAEIHRPPDHIVDECQRLADSGVIEITLLGQTVNHYRFEHGAAVSIGGIQQPQKGRVYAHTPGVYVDPFAEAGAGGERVTTFADLLQRIHDEVPAIERLRFVTSYPRSFGDDVLEVIRDHPRICRYLHVPAQSGSDRLLGLMNRGYTVGEYFEFLDRARAYLHQPEIGRALTVAGDIIVGFPTETDEDYQATEALLRRARYKNCYIFKYSPRPGTIAIDRFTDDVPEAVKRERNNRLLALQNSISGEVGTEFIGQTLSVFVEGISKKQAKRTARAAVASSAGGGAIALTISGRSLEAASVAEQAEDDGACRAGSTVVGATEKHEAAAIDVGAGPVQLSARTEGDVIVFFEVANHQAAAGLVGQVRKVKVMEAAALSLSGVLQEP